MKLLLMGHADLALPEYSSIFEKCSLQDFIVNLAGMEFGAGGHPGLQVIITYKMWPKYCIKELDLSGNHLTQNTSLLGKALQLIWFVD